MGPRVEVVHEQSGAGRTEAELDAEEIRAIWAEVGQNMYEVMGRHPESERCDSEPTKSEVQYARQGEKNEQSQL